MYITNLEVFFSQGLCFIHQSWLQAHGRLRSSKCLINSRFMVKITDYALHDLILEDNLPAANQLWMPPEQLRFPNHVTVATKRRADVYGFAIILSELCLLAVPYITYTEQNPFLGTLY